MTERLRSTLKLGLVFAAGFVAGGLVLGFAVAQNREWILTVSDSAAVNREALVADEILSGRGEEMAAFIVKAMPGMARGLHARRERDEAAVLSALWKVRLLYEKHGLEVPAEIAPLLAGLPAEYAPQPCPRKETGSPAAASAERPPGSV
jgi:hypothetical protein